MNAQTNTLERLPEAEERKTAVINAGPANATTILSAIVQVASNPEADIEKMERLFAMHQKMVAQEAEAAFNAAMARAQAKIMPVANNADNTQTNSRYAKLAAINKAIVPIYTAEGLSISFDTADCPIKDWKRTVAIVSHSAGHSRTYHLDLPLDIAGAKGNVNKTEVHGTGSTNSYGRRYLVCMIFNVTTEDDNDGNVEKRRQDVEPDADGKKKLEACGSMASLNAVWKELTTDQRKTLGEVVKTVRANILAADRAAAAEQ